MFSKEVLIESRQLDIDQPVLGRKREASRRIEDDYSVSSVDFFHEILHGKFTFKYQIYLLMQSKIGSSKRITNATLY